MNFRDCLIECAGNIELVTEFDRLRGTNIMAQVSGPKINAMVDEATGALARDLALFVEFVHEFIWSRLSDPELDDTTDGELYAG